MRDYGIFTIRINGRVYETRGAYTLHHTNFSRKANAYSAGGVYITREAKAPTLEVEFDDDGLSWSDAMLDQTLDVTIAKRGGGQILITNGAFVGDDITKDSQGSVKGASITFDAANVRENS